MMRALPPKLLVVGTRWRKVVGVGAVKVVLPNAHTYTQRPPAGDIRPANAKVVNKRQYLDQVYPTAFYFVSNGKKKDLMGPLEG